MTLRTFADRQALNDALDALNEFGVSPEAACVDSRGIVFIAALYDMGDEAPMGYVYTDSSGHSTGLTQCDACGAEGRRDWKPTYPVLALMAFQS